MAKIFAFLTLRLKLDAHYVLYEMDEYELDALTSNAELVNKEEMEMMRLGAYVNAQAYSKEKIKITDICRFPWETKPVEKAVGEDERRRLAEKAQSYKKYL